MNNYYFLKRASILLLIIALPLHFTSCMESGQGVERQSESQTPVIGEHHFISGYEPLSADSLVNVVIEIPAGTNEKWEVEKESGHIAWEIRDGEPRVIDYIGYVGNYGMVPRTLAGDGDAIDILVLGAPQNRGDIVQARLIGVLEMLDDGEQDDKLIAVLPGTIFSEVQNLADLELSYPSVSTIITLWFENYKGPNNGVEVFGLGDVHRAWEIFSDSMDRYK